MIIQIGKVGFNVEILVSITLEDAYKLFPKLPKLVVKEAHKRANPSRKKKSIND
jgi:hypothetical protein